MMMAYKVLTCRLIIPPVDALGSSRCGSAVVVSGHHQRPMMWFCRLIMPALPAQTVAAACYCDRSPARSEAQQQDNNTDGRKQKIQGKMPPTEYHIISLACHAF